jgi:hypothetical protein
MHGLHFKLQPNKWLQLPKFTIQLSSEKELLREKDLFISLVYVPFSPFFFAFSAFLSL